MPTLTVAACKALGREREAASALDQVTSMYCLPSSPALPNLTPLNLALQYHINPLKYLFCPILYVSLPCPERALLVMPSLDK